MKKINRRSVMCLVLVLIQVFFVFSLTAIAADGTSEGTSKGTVLSLSKTTLVQDLTAEVVAEKDAQLIENQPALSLMGFAAEKSEGFLASRPMFDLFLYMYSPTGFSDAEKIALTMTAKYDGKEQVSSVYGNILDRSKTLVKVVFSDVNGYNCGFNNTEKTLSLLINNVTITRAGKRVSYPIYYDSFGEGAIVNGSYFLKYDLTSGLLVSNERSEILELQVKLVNERVLSANHTYMQINTAMMLLPESYFERFGDLSWVEYIYSLYDKIPMLVLNNEEVFKDVLAGKDVDFGELTYTGLVGDPFRFTSYDVKYTSHFAFFKESISMSETDIEFDVSEEEILKRFYEVKTDYDSYVTHSQSFKEYISADSILLNQVEKISKDDELKKENYAPTFWEKWANFTLFHKYEDNSIDLDKLNVLESADLTLTDSQLSDLYCIDENYIPAFREMAKEIKNGYRLVLMRYLCTDYIVRDFEAYSSYLPILDKYEAGYLTGYVAQNAVIEDFQILKLCFEKADTFGNIQRTIVYPENDPVDGSGGLESDGKIQDQDTVSPTEQAQDWWQEFLDKIQKFFDKLKDIGDVLLKVAIALLIALGVWFLLRFIGAIRDAFGRRYPREDKPPRERRRRK